MEVPPWEGLYSLKIVNGGGGGGRVMKVLLCHVDPNFIRNFTEIPSNSLFISSRMTRGKTLNTVDSRYRPDN